MAMAMLPRGAGGKQPMLMGNAVHEDDDDDYDDEQEGGEEYDDEEEEEEDYDDDEEEEGSSPPDLCSGFASTGGKQPRGSMSVDDMESEEESVGGKRPARYARAGKSPASKRHSPDPMQSRDVAPRLGSTSVKLDWALNHVETMLPVQQVLMTDQSATDEKLSGLAAKVQTLESNAGDARRSDREFAALQRKVAELEKQLQAAPPAFPTTAAAQTGNAVPDWDSGAAFVVYPTDKQVSSLIGALQRCTASLTNRQAIARIMCFTHGDHEAFIAGKRTINLLDSNVPSSTLWQLWAFSIQRRPIDQCVPKPSDVEGNEPGAIDYGTALIACSVQPPVYFIRSSPTMPPPRVRAPSRGSPAWPLAGAYSMQASSSFDMPFSSPAPSAISTPGVSGPMLAMTLTTSPALQRSGSACSVSSSVGTSGPSDRSTARKLAQHVQTFRDRFGEPPSAAEQETATRFLVELAPRIASIKALDAHEESEVNAGRPRPERAEEATYPNWHGTCVPAISGDVGSKCGHTGCGKPGILHECAGCGGSFHFDCCDATRQPPGGDAPWYCGRDECKGSAWRSICGWKPKPLPVDTFQCSMCLDEVNSGLKCELVGSREHCNGGSVCAACVHALVFRIDAGDDSIPCPTCREPCTALRRPGTAVPETFASMSRAGESGDGEDGALVADVVRRRRGSVSLAAYTEQRRMEAEAIEQSRIHAVREEVANGSVSATLAAEMELEARGDLDALLTTGEIDDDRAASAKAAAEGQARSMPGGRARGKAANRTAPAPSAPTGAQHKSPTTNLPMATGPGAPDPLSPSIGRSTKPMAHKLKPAKKQAAAASTSGSRTVSAKPSSFSKKAGSRPCDAPISTVDDSDDSDDSDDGLPLRLHKGADMQ